MMCFKINPPNSSCCFSPKVCTNNQKNESSSDYHKQLHTGEVLSQSPREGPNSAGQSIDQSGADTSDTSTGYRRIQRSSCASLACYHCYTNNISGCRGLECDNITKGRGVGSKQLYYRPVATQQPTHGITDLYTSTPAPLSAVIDNSE